tara:strand:+ start:480 stop:1442 length:963 start_codon:yes stop_codon:yes gene_type:complete
MFDLIIIGAGPIGLACSIEAKKKKLKSLILEKGVLVNSIYNYPQNMTFFSTSDKLEIGEVPFISQNPKPTRPEALEYYRRVCTSWDLDVNLYETVIKIDSHSEIFNIKTDKSNYKSKNIIIATGFYDIPFPLNVEGENLPKVSHYYSEPHPYFGMDIAIVGAANSAVDAALETFRKGAKSVTMIIREKKIRENVKYWSKPDIENRIKEGSIKALFNSEIIEIQKKYVIVKNDKEKIKIKNDFVLAMTGYQPNFQLLKSIGIKFNKNKYSSPYYNKHTMESNVNGVYLAGVICGGYQTNKWFIENSRVHACQIINHIKEKT